MGQRPSPTRCSGRPTTSRQRTTETKTKNSPPLSPQTRCYEHCHAASNSTIKCHGKYFSTLSVHVVRAMLL